MRPGGSQRHRGIISGIGEMLVGGGTCGGLFFPSHYLVTRDSERCERLSHELRNHTEVFSHNLHWTGLLEHDSHDLFALSALCCFGRRVELTAHLVAEEIAVCAVEANYVVDTKDVVKFAGMTDTPPQEIEMASAHPFPIRHRQAPSLAD